MGFSEQLEISVDALFPLYLAILTSFVVAIGVITFCAFYLRRLFAQKLKIQQLENEYRKNLLAGSLQAQEHERLRIAQDLHDDIGASLSTIKLYASHLVELVESEQVSHIPKKVDLLVDNTIARVRQISHNLSSENLMQFGLKSAIGELCNQINEASPNLNVIFEAELTQEINPDKSLHLYRITQELLNNTIKHAQASQISIVLQSISDEVLFEYKDDGIGFDVRKTKDITIQNSSLGTKTIASRVDMLDATIDYQSAPKKGLQVIIQFVL